jgi:hypothetical protein
MANGVVNEDRVKLPAEAHCRHVTQQMLAFRVDLSALLEHHGREIR